MRIIKTSVLALFLLLAVSFAAKAELQIGATVPIGTIITFAGANCPTGYLYADGAVKSKTTYKNLCTVLGTSWGAGDASNCAFPDLRGAFLRGTGTGTINTRSKIGPSVGSFQEDYFQGHTHGFYKEASAGEPASGFMPGQFLTGQIQSISIGDDGANGTPRVGIETRPYNAGVKYCIKY